MRPYTPSLFALVAAVGLLAGCDSHESAKSDAGSSAKLPTAPPKGADVKDVEASCGECQLGMEGDGCDLAVRIDGKAYFVSGAKMGDYGDAHAADGFCNAIRKARVTGS